MLTAKSPEYLRSERGLAPMAFGAYSSRAARLPGPLCPGRECRADRIGRCTAAVLAEASGLLAGQAG